MLNLWENMVAENKMLAFGSLFFIVLSFIIAILLPFEERQVLGINLWIKPLKFSLSIAIFLITSYFLLLPLAYSSAKQTTIGWILLITMLVEIGCIVFQAARAQLSHFNITDSIGSIMFPLMGLAITVAYLVYAVLLFDYFKVETNLPAPLLWSIRLGIIIFLFGAVSGFMMASGLKHSVGIEDGGPGLAFVNWSTVGGDLRVSHFFSIHAIQILPLVVLAVLQVTSSDKLAWVILLIITAGWVFFTLVTFLQALQGRPFIRI